MKNLNWLVLLVSIVALIGLGSILKISMATLGDVLIPFGLFGYATGIWAAGFMETD